ncbi:MAG: SDR family oxidoreductase [Burkholderiales bacterium]|nr:SDR family oxidoreductase [Burkholderiales bacterium]
MATVDASARARVLGLIRTNAIELGKHAITINASEPGMALTKRVRAQPRYVDLNERAQERQSIKRPGSVDDIVSGIIFYAPPASRFVKGDAMHIIGGRMG